jgi:hypothetical protein
MIKATGLIVVSFRRVGMPAPLVILNRFMKLDIVSKTPSQGKTKFFVSSGGSPVICSMST